MNASGSSCGGTRGAVHEGHARFPAVRLFRADRRRAARSWARASTHVNIFDDPELREALKRFSNWPTYPQLYVKGELVGGCDIAHGDVPQRRAEDAARVGRRARRAGRRLAASRPSRLVADPAARAAPPSCQPSARARCSARMELPCSSLQTMAEQVGGALGVVASPNAPTRCPTPCPRPCAALRQHRLPERRAGQRRGVEAGERVEGIALDARARHRRVEEAEVERRRCGRPGSRAGSRARASPARTSRNMRCSASCSSMRRAQRVPGIDPVDLQRCRIDVARPRRASRGRNASRRAPAGPSASMSIDHRGDLQQRVGGGD